MFSLFYTRIGIPKLKLILVYFAIILGLFTFFNPLFAISKNNFYKKYIQNHESIPVEEKIGQMLLVGFSGDTFSKETKSYINDYKVGGVIFFSSSTTNNRKPNISSPEQLAKLIKNLQKTSKVPLFISLDQEGGLVARLRETNGFPEMRIPSHQDLGKLDNPQDIYDIVNKMSKEMHKLGININFAPVVDVNVNPSNPIIGKLGRSFSDDPNKVYKDASLFIKAQTDNNIISVIKHFPGHGSSTKDSHLEFVDVTETYKQEIELSPYKELFANGFNGGVMTAHLYNKNMDEIYPTSLSYKVITELLKNQLGFKGLIFSDDLKMKGITNHYNQEEALILAVNAGSDIIVYGNNIGEYNPTFVKDAIATLKVAVESGKISKERIDESYLKIMNTKYEYFFK